MTTPWKPLPRPRPLFPGSVVTLAPGEKLVLRAPRPVPPPLHSSPGFRRSPTRRRVWRTLEDSAARGAAPWWALAWLVTAGRFGKPLWKWEEREGEWVPFVIDSRWEL